MVGSLLRLILLCQTVSARKDLYENSKNIVSLAPEDLTSIVLVDHKAWMVAYYVDWCPHCIGYAKFYSTSADMVSDEKRVRFGALNCATYVEYCHSLGLHGYPLLRAYRFPDLPETFTKAGMLIDHKDIRNEQQFHDWIRAQRLPDLGSQAKEAGPQGSFAKKVRADLQPHAVPHHAIAEEDLDPSSVPLVRLVDAKVALMYSLRQGTFLQGEDTESGLVLRGAPLAELCLWLDFLSRVFPGNIARKDIAGLSHIACAAKYNGGGLTYKYWGSVLDQSSLGTIPPEAGAEPENYWRLCDNYACGLWTLFHLLTLAAADKQVSDAILTLRSNRDLPGEAMQRIRGFVANFFGCDKCVAHFLETYDACDAGKCVGTGANCSFGRCSLQADDGQGIALWLWKVHDGVSASIAAEPDRDAPVPAGMKCPHCWVDGVLDENATFSELKRRYWHQDWSIKIDFLKDLWKRMTLQHVMSGFIFLVMFTSIGVNAWNHRPRYHAKKTL